MLFEIFPEFRNIDIVCIPAGVDCERRRASGRFSRYQAGRHDAGTAVNDPIDGNATPCNQ